MYSFKGTNGKKSMSRGNIDISLDEVMEMLKSNGLTRYTVWDENGNEVASNFDPKPVLKVVEPEVITMDEADVDAVVAAWTEEEEDGEEDNQEEGTVG